MGNWCLFLSMGFPMLHFCLSPFLLFLFPFSLLSLLFACFKRLKLMYHLSGIVLMTLTFCMVLDFSPLLRRNEMNPINSMIIAQTIGSRRE